MNLGWTLLALAITGCLGFSAAAADKWPPADASSMPSAENATEWTGPVCTSMEALSLPVAASHSLTVPSMLPEARVRLSGE